MTQITIVIVLLSLDTVPVAGYCEKTKWKVILNAHLQASIYFSCIALVLNVDIMVYTTQCIKHPTSAAQGQMAGDCN